MKRFITGSSLILVSILSGFPVQAGKSLDEIDRESFAAKYTLSELPGISMIPVLSVDTVRSPESLSLDGTGNVMRRVESLKGLGVTPKKQIKSLEE
jgi:hypothetical protein